MTGSIDQPNEFDVGGRRDSHDLSRALTKMTEAMEKLAGGDVTTVVPCIGRADKLGRMAATVQFFKERAIAEIKRKAQEKEENKRWQQEDEERLARETLIGQLSDAMTALADGNVSINVPGAGRTDALGRMAAAVQFFQERAITEIKRKAQEVEDIKRWQQEDAERLAREAEAAHQDQIAIDSLALALARLADGDLVYRIETIFAPKTEKLRLDFNGAAEKLRQAMQSIRASSQVVHVKGGEISSAVDDLSGRSEEQAASLEEAAASLQEITATVKTTARNAIHATDVVSGTKSDADKSGEVVRKAIAAMGSIETSSKQISQIIGVIDEIAFQTNILALNAGVEAARAGEAGRGFAVIASEVRALAGRAAGAAKEIKNLISTSAAQVKQGVDLVGATSEALVRIFVQVAEIDTIVSGITASAQGQAEALQQVNTAVTQIDQLTQQNAAMVEETSASAQVLTDVSNELAHLVGRFQVSRDGAAEPGRAERKANRQGPPARAALNSYVA